jgi:Transposase, Mutator family
VAVSKMELLELVSKAEGGDVDFLREGVRVLAQALMEAEVSVQIGAEHGERTPQRTTHRNGYRPRDWDTRVGTIELAVPRVLWELPPVDPGAAPVGRAGPDRGGRPGLCGGRIHPPGR